MFTASGAIGGPSGVRGAGLPGDLRRRRRGLSRLSTLEERVCARIGRAAQELALEGTSGDARRYSGTTNSAPGVAKSHCHRDAERRQTGSREDGRTQKTAWRTAGKFIYIFFSFFFFNQKHCLTNPLIIVRLGFRRVAQSVTRTVNHDFSEH